MTVIGVNEKDCLTGKKVLRGQAKLCRTCGSLSALSLALIPEEWKVKV